MRSRWNSFELLIDTFLIQTDDVFRIRYSLHVHEKKNGFKKITCARFTHRIILNHDDGKT